MIGVALRFGRLPHELLAATDSRELSELFAFFKLQAEEIEEAERQQDQETSWRQLLSRPNG